jgi:cytochrome P450
VDQLPGPRLPPAAQTAEWLARPGPFLLRCHAEHGDTFRLRLARIGTLAVVSDPETLKRVFAAPPEVLSAARANAELEPVLGSRSTLLLDGDEHLRQRRLTLPHLHGRRLAGYADLMDEIAGDHVQTWPVGEPVALLPRLQAVALEVILRVVFGITDPARLTPLRAAVREMITASLSPWVMIPWLQRDAGARSPWGRLMRSLADLDALIHSEIDARRADPALGERTDIFSLLAAAEDDAGRPLSQQELRDELVTLLVAGYETTATGLAWSFELLSRHPEARARAVAEARDGEGVYIEAVVREALRLRPPFPLVGRTALEPYEIAGVEVPPGTIVGPCIYLAHRRAQAFDEPDAFRPERFLDHRPETYSWLPFGGGVRRCVGASFATLEMEVVLRAALARVEPLPARAGRPERTQRRAFVLAPARGARVVLRQHSAKPFLMANGRRRMNAAQDSLTNPRACAAAAKHPAGPGR